MHFGAPQIILCVLYCLSLGVNLAKHGQPKTGKESFWTGLIAIIIVVTLLIWGGFFSK
jgi:LPXTG-motif cell wall-anchored protein